MRRLIGFMTLGFSLLSLGFMILVYAQQAATLPLVAAAVCWMAGFAWFIRFGREARGWQRYVLAAAFWVLCVTLLGCVAYLVMVFNKM